MARTPALARRFFDRFEPVHAVTYFSPESRQALDAMGFRGFWMGYFAARSAPLGQVPAAGGHRVVLQLLRRPGRQGTARGVGNRHARRGHRCPAGHRRWQPCVDTASPRTKTSTTAAELAAKAARSAPVDGRALFAANSALPWPTAPIEVLWHAATLLREHRGDGHIAALVSAGITGREANVLHCASGGVPADFIKRSRDYDEVEWQHCTDSLGSRGLLSDDGAFTAAGRELKDHIEDLTDTLALSALDGCDDGEIETLFATLTPITRAVIAGGDLPAATPMGLRRDELDDASAHLS